MTFSQGITFEFRLLCCDVDLEAVLDLDYQSRVTGYHTLCFQVIKPEITVCVALFYESWRIVTVLGFTHEQASQGAHSYD